jgi:RNA-directed DNA polymerase
VVQTALTMVLEPIFERDFAPQSYGFRPGKGCKDALRRVKELLEAGHSHVVDVDLKSYFDTIPNGPLLALVGQKVTDGQVLARLEGFLGQGVLEGTALWTPEQGTPQGAVVSPLLSNIYLDPLDQLMAAQGYEMVRYADDFVVLCRSPEEAAAALVMVQGWTTSAGLTLHPTKTRLVDVRSEGFDFLGYHFVRDLHWPRDKSIRKLKDTIRAKTRRTSGHSLPRIISDLNRTLRGWFAYFQHSHRTTFPPLDKWIRRRLRSILRKRSRRRGISGGQDHQRWPNAFFAEHGLLNLQAAHDLACQSPRG